MTPNRHIPVTPHHLAGNPAVLEREVNGMEATTAAILEALSILKQLAAESSGQAMAAFNEKAADSSEHMGEAWIRYDTTTSALRTYQVSLESAHHTGNRAADRYHDAHGDYERWDYEYDQKHRELINARRHGVDLSVIDELEREVSSALWHRGEASDRVDGARATFVDAVETLDDAAQRAIAQIDAAFSITNDTFGDKFRHALSQIANALSVVAQWVMDVLKGVLDFLADLVMVILTIVAIVLLAVLLIALIAVVLVVVLVALGVALALVGLIVAILIPIVINIVLTLAGVIAIGVLANFLGVPPVWTLRIAMVFVVATSPLLGSWILSNYIQDRLADPPTPVLVTGEEDLEALLGRPPSPDEMLAWDIITSDEPITSADQLAQLAAAVDTLGGAGPGTDNATFVLVKTLPGPPERHIVVPPSTQDWSFGFDGGALNDFGGNVGLASDLWDTQFEKMVVQSMREAGIQLGEPVLFVGFSQGSLVNCEIARDYQSEFTVGGIINFGGPVGLQTPSGDYPFIEVRNTGNAGPFSYPDPVSLLDFNNDVINSGDHHTYVLPDGGWMPHDMDQYTSQIAENPALNQEIGGLLSDFLNKPGQPQVYGATEH